MAGEKPAVRESGPYRLTTRGDAQWMRLVPWVVVVPLAAIAVSILFSGPLDAQRIVPAGGVALAIAVVCLPAIVSFTPGVRVWALRTATVRPEGLAVDRPGREPFAVEWAGIGRVHTHTESTGLRIPPAVQLVTEFFGPNGSRIPELALHHSTYRYGVRTFDGNPDGAALLLALEETPLAPVLDVATRALVDLVYRTKADAAEGFSERAAKAARAGRLWHALRFAERDALESARTSVALVRLCVVLAHKAVDTARTALEERPGLPLLSYLLAHALLSDIGVSHDPGPVALAHRSELRTEARGLFEGLAGDPEFGKAALLDLRALRPLSHD